METPNTSAELEQQALAVFNHAGHEIRFFRGQQWLVTNYALLAYGALAATPQALDDACLKATASAFCAAVVIFAFVGAGLVLRSLEKSQGKELARMNAARWKLPLVWAVHTRFQFRPGARSDRPSSLIWLLSAVLVIGALLAFSINLSRAPWGAACLSAGAQGAALSASTRQGGDPTAPGAAQGVGKVFTYPLPER